MAVISGGGGFCVTVADACNKIGLYLPPLDEESRNAIKTFISPVAPEPVNPVDLAGDMRPWVYSKVIDIIGRQDYIDGILATTPFWLPIQYSTPDSIKALSEAVERLLATLREIKKPFIMVQTADITNNPVASLFREENIPMYETPGASVRAMNALATYGKRFATDHGIN